MGLKPRWQAWGNSHPKQESMALAVLASLASCSLFCSLQASLATMCRS